MSKVQNGAEKCLLDVNLPTKPQIIREDEFVDWSRSVAKLVETHPFSE